MMMRSIRANTKWIMVFLAVAFAAWLVLDWVQSRDTQAASGANPVIAVVNRQEIRYIQWSNTLELALNNARATRGDAVMTDEETRQVELVAWDQLIQDVLIQQEIDRLGIRVTDAEVQQAFRLSPPPDLMRYPAFMTDGVFDYAKYQQFFSDPSVDEQILLQIESYYRQTLPRARLSQMLQQGGAVSDAELWQEFRDRNEAATVTFATVPANPRVEVEVSDSEMRAYYRDHVEDFERPAAATIGIVSFATTPGARDTMYVRALADTIRMSVLDGSTTFEEAAAQYSADAATRATGGQLGRFGPGQLLPSFEEATTDLAPGDVAEPVASPQGFHLLQVTERTGDTVAVSHILLPVELSPDGEDEMFDLMDEFEGAALIDGLTMAADSVGVAVATNVTVTEGFDFVPGAGALGVAVDWALDPLTPLDEVSEFFQNAAGYHMVEVAGRVPGGTFSFEEVRDQIRETLASERRHEAALETARSEWAAVEAGTSLEEAAAGLGWTIGTAGPFTRRQFAAGLGRNTEAVGAAFAAPTGESAGPLDAGDAVVFLRVDDRTQANPEMFIAIREQLRSQMQMQAAQTNVSRWIAGLRETATIVDRRDRLNQRAAAGV
ncbi:MAG: SurA N-terminal domain-containing protein [Gemmatimonadetes bacterium]|nr:SurA N-terminal domain-containing protein [Gemmatimonadota bacterium]